MYYVRVDAKIYGLSLLETQTQNKTHKPGISLCYLNKMLKIWSLLLVGKSSR